MLHFVQHDKPKSAVKVITDYVEPGNNLERISPAFSKGESERSEQGDLNIAKLRFYVGQEF